MGGIQGPLDQGLPDCVLALERKLNSNNKEEIVPEAAYPFPVVTEEAKAEQRATSVARDRLGARSESSETIRPRLLRPIETEPAVVLRVADEPRAACDDDPGDYPICHSPKFEQFQRPLLLPTPEPDEAEYDYRCKLQIPSVGMWSPPPALRREPGAGQQSPTPPNALGIATHPHKTPALGGGGGGGGGPTTTPARMWGSSHPSGPSPGYTVASLPPAKRRDTATADEVTAEFVEDVYRYLGLQFENVAVRFDYEIASYVGTSVVLVRRDRRAALTKYCEKWVHENPDLETGSGQKGGLW